MRTERHRKTDMKKLIVAFRKFANEPKIKCGTNKSKWHYTAHSACYDIVPTCGWYRRRRT